MLAPQVRLLSPCLREYVMHRLHNQSGILVKEHRRIMVITDDTGSVSATGNQRKPARRIARVIMETVAIVIASVLDEHVHHGRGAALWDSHVLDLL